MKPYIAAAVTLAVILIGALTVPVARAAPFPPGSISGFVYVDLNNDGVKDAGEPGIAGVTITLSGSDTGVTTTDANGAYTFVLEPGCCTYTVAETQPAGYSDGIDSVGDSGGTLANDVISDISIDSSAAAGYNFGELPLTTPTATSTAQGRLKTHTPTVTPTAPPSTATPTSPPATSTPQPSATKPGAGAGGVVRAPDTGTGGSGGRDTTAAGIVFAALALLLSGTGIAVRGVWRQARQRR